mgnify:CR=1 FL=1
MLEIMNDKSVSFDPYRRKTYKMIITGGIIRYPEIIVTKAKVKGVYVFKPNENQIEKIK